MRAAEIRQAFLRYFKEKGHTIVSSSSLVPDDPTLLLTNAGMVQFKNVFLGLERRPYTRAATVQKCARLSGKHNDLEEVGPSPRHHTFFEMLGNFSFGDYFKRGAIAYAWEFLLDELKIDPERLWPTVYEDDEEAAHLWREISGIPDERVGRLPASENWWSMGETGPNGPCSEIFYDRGIENCTCSLDGDCTPYTASVEETCERFWEIWNLVFMQYHTDESGETTPLEHPSVDTGMGLERATAALTGAATNYETDLFLPLMRKVQQLVGHSDAEMEQQIVPYRVIADHSRAMTFLMADGVLPGNEERNYILRMLIRRAIRFGKQLGFKQPFLQHVVQTVIDEMGDFYTELRERRNLILKAIGQEEERFERTYRTGIDGIEALLKEKERQGKRVISGDEAFFLHDTHGFHIQIIEDIARERGFTVDREGFERAMAKQRERSRDGSATANVETVLARTLKEALKNVKATEFVGYHELSCESSLLFRASLDGKSEISLDMPAAQGEYVFIFNKTPFYAEGGGQVADTGTVANETRAGRARVYGVRRDKVGVCYHQVEVLEGEFHQGDRCRLQVNAELRRRTMRNHTATHILHAALRKVLGHQGGIQAGSLVAPDELRFDFTHLEPLSAEEIREIEALANEMILNDLPVQVTYEPLEDARAKGAMALFPEDYQGKEKVRVVSIVGEEGNGAPFSIELCGGTHVRRTGEIGLFKIIREEGVSAGVRRVYVATGENLLRYLNEKERRLRELAARLSSTESELLPKVASLLEERAALERELERFKRERLVQTRDELLGERERVGEADLITARVDLDGEQLKELTDLLTDALDQGVVLLGSGLGGKAMLVCKVSEPLTDRIEAGDLVREAAEHVGGKGGGSPRFAQGGGPDPQRLSDALEVARRSIREQLSNPKR